MEISKKIVAFSENMNLQDFKNKPMQEDNKSKGLLYILKFESIFFRVKYSFRG